MTPITPDQFLRICAVLEMTNASEAMEFLLHFEAYPDFESVRIEAERQALAVMDAADSIPPKPSNFSTHASMIERAEKLQQIADFI